MIATDLDGSLLRDDKTVSERTKSVLRQCREAGIKVVYATGRGGSAERLTSAECFDGRAIINGTFVYDGGTMLCNNKIPFDVARPVLMSCNRRGIKISTQWGGMKYANFVMSDVWPDVTNFQIADFATHEIDAEELLVGDLQPEDAKYIRAILPEELYLVVLRDNFGQIMHRDATKAKAIAALARNWGISQSEIAAFGDDLNDVDMLSYAGIGVAMGNALDEVIAVSDFVCLRNDEDGIADWLTTHLL
jgi:hypothetical protein